MKLFGSTTNPVEFCLWMNDNHIPYSLNKLRLMCQNVVFDSILQLLIHKNRIGNRRVIVFDVYEKLQTIVDIDLIDKISLPRLQEFVLTRAKPDGLSTIRSKDINYIGEIIETSKNSGIMHIYNTNLYKISKDIRDQIKQLIVHYCSGKLSYAQITETLQEIQFLRRNKTTKETLGEIIILVQSPEFDRIRKTIQEIIKLKKPCSGEEIKLVAEKNGAEPYDVRYLYSLINK